MTGNGKDCAKDAECARAALRACVLADTDDVPPAHLEDHGAVALLAIPPDRTTSWEFPAAGSGSASDRAEGRRQNLTPRPRSPPGAGLR